MFYFFGYIQISKTGLGTVISENQISSRLSGKRAGSHPAKRDGNRMIRRAGVHAVPQRSIHLDNPTTLQKLIFSSAETHFPPQAGTSDSPKRESDV